MLLKVRRFTTKSQQIRRLRRSHSPDGTTVVYLSAYVDLVLPSPGDQPQSEASSRPPSQGRCMLDTRSHATLHTIQSTHLQAHTDTSHISLQTHQSEAGVEGGETGLVGYMYSLL
jgi:hypothetical protein